jgi:D-glycero-alpha-D-manno-heptose-7-phosphate kinase
VGEHWVHQRALHPGITTERIDALEREVTSAGAIGMKALGASGGGCVMVFARAGHEDRVRNALREFAEPLVWRVAEGGVTVREETGVMPSARRPAR